jgi:hypothetical protein
MKALLLPISLLFLTLPSASAMDPDKRMANIAFDHWSKASIPSFELTDATFEQGYDRLLREWADQTIGAAFPLVLSDFEIDPSLKGGASRVTMSLRDVPFVDALDLLCKATGRKIIPKSGPFHIQSAAPADMSGSWDTRAYPLSPTLRKQLDLIAAQQNNQMLGVYQPYGIHFESWMNARVVGDRLLVLASEEQHQQIALIHRLLEAGYTITPPKNK